TCPERGEWPGKGGCDQHRDRPLRAVEQQGRRGEPTPTGSQHVGRADIARADGADVANARSPGEQQPEGNRAEQVSNNDKGVGGKVHPKTRLPAFHVPSTRPSSALPSNGVFCALPGNAPASTCQARSGWNRQRSAEAPLASRPASTPSRRAGRAVSRSIAWASVKAPPWTCASVTASS